MRFLTEQKFDVIYPLAKLALLLLLVLPLPNGFAKADAPADDRPIIMCPTLPLRYGPVKKTKPEEQTQPANDKASEPDTYETSSLIRELGHQLVINVFRDEFGLPTRDESLFEPIDLGSDHLFEIDVVAVHRKSIQLIVRHKGEQIFSQKVVNAFARSAGHRCSSVLDSKFKPDLIAAIEKIGYQKIDRTMPPTGEFTPLPDSIEKDLRSMNHLKQFAALRKIHRLIRTEGPSTSRLCGLVRGYATLSQLTYSTLDSRNDVFVARTLLYERQMRVLSKHAVQAISTEAYSDVMLGYPNRAYGHYLKAMERFDKENIEPDDWLPLMNDYIHYRDSKIEQVMQDEDSSLREIAALLRFRSGLQSVTAESSFSKLHSGKLALEVIPTCQWIYDHLSYNSGVAPGHRWNALTPIAISMQLQDFLPTYDELPQEIKNKVGKIKASGGFNQTVAAEIANQLVAASKDDKSEPSIAVLGRNIEAWNVMHIARTARFNRVMIGFDIEPFMQQHEPIFKNHPSAGLVRSIAIQRSSLKSQQEYLDKCNELIKDMEYKHPNYMSDHLFLGNLHVNAKFSNGITANTARKIAETSNCNTEHSRYLSYYHSLSTAYWAKTICNRSPSRMAMLFKEDWSHNKQNFEQWVKDYPDSPAMLLTAAKIYAEELNSPKKSKELYEKYLAQSPDGQVLFDLAKTQFYQSKSDDWIETLIRIFDTEDQGLQHSNAAARLAFTLMREDDFDLALEWAERANQSGSGRGMLALQQCYTGVGRLDEASAIGRENAYRYQGLNSALDWFVWCGANQHEDLDDAWEFLQKSYRRYTPEATAEDLIHSNEVYYHLYKGDLDLAVASLRSAMYKSKSLKVGLSYAVFCDQIDDKKNRDKTLRQIIAKETDTPSIYPGLAKAFQSYFKTRKFDLVAYEKLYNDFPKFSGDREMTDYLTTITFLKHGNKEDKDAVILYLTKKSMEINRNTIKQLDVLRHLKMTELGEAPIYFTIFSKQQAWTRITPTEVMVQNKARLKKIREEHAKRARKNDYKPEYEKRIEANQRKRAEALKKKALEKKALEKK